MNKRKQQIGWQKYEDLLEQQLTSPILRLLLDPSIQEEEEDHDEHTRYEDSQDNDSDDDSVFPILNITDDLANHIAMSSNFDCWVGHTNFDITPSVFNAMNELEGVEILKVFSRYRFFIGVGRMFKFKNVRKELESTIISKPGEQNERED